MNKKAPDKYRTMGALDRTAYQKLLRDIGEIYEDARKALIKTWWLIGQRIVKVEQGGSPKAPVGSRLLKRLSRDLTREHSRGFSYTNLKNMRRFYLDNLNRQPAGDLGVAHHVELLPVRDPKKRRQLEKLVLRKGLNRDEARSLVRAENSNRERKASPPSAPRLLTPVRGRLDTHQIVEKGGALYLDLGFRNYRRLTPAQAAHFKKHDLVQTLSGGGLRALAGAAPKDLFTYEAALDRIYDGDTQWYFIFTGRREARGMRHDKLRLRGIDCPELATSAGRAAKKFVEELFGRSVKITVTTTKPDKFDRYLSDIFLLEKEGAWLFLNNELLKNGHARLYGDPQPGDWGD